ncbi:MAG TPA: transglycosylase SLT domain-containing protein [Bryobacteraceae bacterium]|nr:transglycosylase SLT domain-containing protein [Bryobacteraceae bacterium]
MPHFSGRNILGRNRKDRKRRAAILGGALVAIAAAGVVLRAASTDPLAELKAGAAALDASKYAVAIKTLAPLAKRIPKLADYAAWLLASAQFDAKNYADVPKALEPVWKQIPISPLTARAALLASKAYLQTGDATNALEILRRNYASLAQPPGDLAMADAFAAAGDSISAAIYNQRVYYSYPNSAEAAQADANMAKLRDQLGDNYPPAMPNAMLGRALKLLTTGNAPRARKELETIIPLLGGSERDEARVRVGVAEYEAKDNLRAEEYLASLEGLSPEADAERLCYIALAARRLKNHEEVHASLDKLARLYPNSSWRLQALISDANSHLIDNEFDTYEPLYRACYESFPTDPQAAGCHWKIAWGHYLRRREDAQEMLRTHLRLFPSSENSPAAMYFLGRLAEDAKDPGAARAWYEEIAREYPNYYYTILARERLIKVEHAPASPAVAEFLRSVKFQTRSRKLNFAADANSKSRIERARLLASADLEDWAEVELRYAAQNENQPQVMAMELATLSSRHERADQAMRYIKRYAPAYLFLPLDSAPAEFWKLAFPLPYRDSLDRFARQNGLDPFLVAALIRQESEFNPKAVSPANARGLTQILPTTGRELSRRLRVRPYSTASLFQPAVNLELGTFYLKNMVDGLGGRWEVALAAYNAGLSRAHAWMTWGEFREPAEFIETVPFTETRNYIQTVLRNAEFYRRLYGAATGARPVTTPGN